MQKILKNMIWNAVGTVFYSGCLWLLTVAVVRFEGGYTDAGILSLAMSASGPLILIATLSLRNFQVSELDGRFSDGDFLVNRFFSTAASLLLCFAFLAVSGYSKYICKCIIIYYIFRTSEAFADVLHGIDQRAWRLDVVGKSYLLRGVGILLSIFCSLLSGKGLLLSALLMAVFSYLIILFFDYRMCKSLAHPYFSWNKSNVILLGKIGIPLVCYSMFLTLLTVYPRFVIERLYGEELLGYFSSVSTPTVLVSQMASFIFSPLMGVFAEHRKQRNRKKLFGLVGLSLGGTVAIGAVAVVAGKLLGEWALVLLFGESIRPYIYLLIPIIFTAVITAMIWLLCGLLTVFKDFFMLALLNFISLIVCVISSHVLINDSQLTGAVIALTMTFVTDVLLLSIRFIVLLKKEDLL